MFQAAKTIFGVIKATRLIITQKIELKVQTLTAAGAVNLTTPLTNVRTTGAIALTLADGVAGQVKTIIMTLDGGAATLTPSNLGAYNAGAVTTVVFDDIGDQWTGIFLSGSWYTLGTPIATVS